MGEINGGVGSGVKTEIPVDVGMGVESNVDNLSLAGKDIVKTVKGGKLNQNQSKSTEGGERIPLGNEPEKKLAGDNVINPDVTKDKGKSPVDLGDSTEMIIRGGTDEQKYAALAAAQKRIEGIPGAYARLEPLGGGTEELIIYVPPEYEELYKSRKNKS